MDFLEKKAWLAFAVFQGIGPQRFKLLYDFFGSAQASLTASEKDLRATGLPEKIVDRFLFFRKNFNADSYFLRLQKLNIEVVCLEEQSYPKMLKETVECPLLLFVKWRGLSSAALRSSPVPGWYGASKSATTKINDLFQKKAIAVVGTRKVTGYGRQVTEMMVQGLVDAGLVIVSGLARGVDRIAHETTIKNNGLTVAVLGHGLDLIYPPEHKDLANQIMESGGALISEFPLGLQPVPGNFPARNRILSGLSLGVVVTEAAEDSGSLITARAAAEQGREVFAVPGPITSPLSAGSSVLIKKGAKLVTKVEDILEELGITVRVRDRVRVGADPRVRPIEGLSEDERKIVEL
ncbi:MAG: DNA-processing protein DprA, partial [Patescibacteria group bacterium]|nr:DNA-processing protein DprA [Patescibacteria group bacterium]